MDTLWLPDGYGPGTIIYDLEHNPYVAGNKRMGGVNIYEIAPVDKDFAKARIAQGAAVLTSN